MQKMYKRSFDQIQAIVADTERFFAEAKIDESLRMKVDLSVEELFVNMVSYNTETVKDILIEMRSLESGIEASLTDYDVHLVRKTVDNLATGIYPLAERAPGGLGLYLVLKMADSIHYEYHDRKSKITFTNRLQQSD